MAVPAIAVAWSTLLLCGRWRPATDWVTRWADGWAGVGSLPARSTLPVGVCYSQLLILNFYPR
jgi:hypothetical protein